jgi:hypothetical protein
MEIIPVMKITHNLLNAIMVFYSFDYFIKTKKKPPSFAARDQCRPEKRQLQTLFTTKA